VTTTKVILQSKLRNSPALHQSRYAVTPHKTSHASRESLTQSVGTTAFRSRHFFCKFSWQHLLQIRQLTVASIHNSMASYLLSKFRTFWIISSMKTSVSVCIERPIITDYTSTPHHWNIF